MLKVKRKTAVRKRPRRGRVMPGIYRITCTRTADHYVGQAVDIPVRWSQHKRALEKGEHQNRNLQRLWNAYGGDAFSWTVLEYCPRRMLDDREAAYIDVYGGLNLKRPRPEAFEVFRVKYGNTVAIAAMTLLVIVLLLR